MAKAKVGGTSAKLRGVVGDYIYQIVRNPAGYSEQKVITYTREKLNRNTKYQCLARMQITMFMNCMNLLTPIICDSFEGLRSRVNSCNRFVQINMPLIQDYCVEHWEDAPGASWPRKGNGNKTLFPFWISEGSYKLPRQFSWSVIRYNGNWPRFVFSLKGTACRKIDLRKILGMSNSDSINVVYWFSWPNFILLMNLQFNPQFNDYTVITDSNVNSLFNVNMTKLGYNGNLTFRVEKDFHFNSTDKAVNWRLVTWAKSVYMEFREEPELFSFIFSKRKGNVWLRNTNKFIPNVYDGGVWDYGEPPCDAYYDWDPNYNGESYNDYFVK